MRASLPCAVTAAWLVGCNAIFGVDALSFGTTSSSTAAGGSGAAGVGGSTLSSSGNGGQGGTPSGALADTKLVARYYIDEAASGKTTPLLLDAAPSPFDLPISYGATLQYVEVAGNRGLENTTADLGGAYGVYDANVGTKIFTLLNGATSVTVEAVLEYPMVTVNTARILYIGPATNDGELALHIDNTSGALAFNFNNPLATQNSATTVTSLAGAGRIVVHAVANTAEANPSDRVRFYLGGTPIPASTDAANVPPAQGEALNLSANNNFAIGNRPPGDRPFLGTLYYVAVYGAALSPQEVANNAAVLANSDDAP